jgi:hypothetical protein
MSAPRDQPVGLTAAGTSMTTALAARHIQGRPDMKQMQKTKCHRGSAGGQQEPLAVDPRDPDIVHAHRIALRSSRPGTGRVGSVSRAPSAPVCGR